jgi:uncharacterized membrane protein
MGQSLTGSGPLNAKDGLGMPTSFTSSYANDINSHGVIVGYATKSNGESGFLACTISEAYEFTNQGGWQDLENLGGDDSVATAINLSGDVVGYSTTIANPPLGETSPIRAFISTGSGAPQDLNDLIDSKSGWTLVTATGINDQGVIVRVGIGPGLKVDAYELIPITPGSTPPTPSPTPTPTPIPTSPPTPMPTPTRCP